MISKLEQKIIINYLKTKRTDGFLNIISIFSFIGISLGVAILIIVMSVMNGFRSELTNKIIGFNAHIVIKPYEKKIDLNKFQNKEILNLEPIFLSSNSGEAIIISKEYSKGVLLRGYSKTEFKKLKIVNEKNFQGNKFLNRKHISIGKELSFNLNLKLGDKIVIMSPTGVNTIIGSIPKQETYIIDSIFDSGLLEYDQNVAFININDLENLFDLPKTKRFVEVFLKNPNSIEDIKSKFQKLFFDEYIYSWSDLNRSLFSALKIERNVMFIILSLIIVVAAFNIISGLTILVKNKTKDIAILKSIGVQNYSIKKIFFMVGFVIGLTATAFGVILGILFSIYIENFRLFLSDIFNIQIFPEEIYFLSKMPSEINLSFILIISLISIIITSIVSLYPAVKASKLDTVKSLKYE